jgi:hypothetical protein
LNKDCGSLLGLPIFFLCDDVPGDEHFLLRLLEAMREAMIFGSLGCYQAWISPLMVWKSRIDEG